MGVPTLALPNKPSIGLIAYGFYSGNLIRCLICSYHGRSHPLIEALYFCLAGVTFVMSLIWMYCWSVLDNVGADINEIFFGKVQHWLDWYALILIISFFLFIYNFVILLSGGVVLLYSRPFYLSLSHKIGLIFTIISYSIAFAVFGKIMPVVNLWHLISASVEMTSPFLQLFSLMLWVFFSIYLHFVLFKVKVSAIKIGFFILYNIFFLFLCTIPYWLYSPCIKSGISEIPKPKIIGHRGAPTVAPENTMLSFQKAVECGVYAFESDVRISSDGVPFLMHDSSLYRTTNVSEEFPSRKHDRPETFSWSELRRLNAGQWFHDFDPFLYNIYCNKECQHRISSQTILSFEEWVSFAAANNKTIMFDLFKPPVGHLNRSNYEEGVIKIILESDILQENVLWLLSHYKHHQLVQRWAPGFRLLTHNILPNATAYNIFGFNIPYFLATDKVIALNFSVIEYVADTSVAFSRAWCQGAWAVTTNYCSYFSKLKRPSYSMTKPVFIFLWTFFNLMAIVAVAYVCVIFHRNSRIHQVDTLVKVSEKEEQTTDVPSFTQVVSEIRAPSLTN